MVSYLSTQSNEFTCGLPWKVGGSWILTFDCSILGSSLVSSSDFSILFSSPSSLFPPSFSIASSSCAVDSSTSISGLWEDSTSSAMWLSSTTLSPTVALSVKLSSTVSSELFEVSDSTAWLGERYCVKDFSCRKDVGNPLSLARLVFVFGVSSWSSFELD